MVAEPEHCSYFCTRSKVKELWRSLKPHLQAAWAQARPYFESLGNGTDSNKIRGCREGSALLTLTFGSFI
jgi:hypothetical protein